MSNKQLAILFSEDQVKIGKYSGEAWSFASCNFTDKKTESLKYKLTEFLSDEKISPDDFDEFSLSYFSPKATLVPNAIFSAVKPEQYLKLAFGDSMDPHDIDYNRISEIALVNIFQLPLWLKSFFVIRYPRMVIQHELTHTLRGIFSASAFKLKLNLQLFHNNITISVSKENALLFCNTFDFENEDDILYHLTLIIDKLHLSETKGECQLSDAYEIHSGILESVMEKSKRSSNLSGLTFSMNNKFSFNNQLLCV